MQQVSRHCSRDEYLAIEEMSNIKHEYDSGEIFAMSGASQQHNDIALNIYAAFRSAISSLGCRANVSDVRLRTPSGLYAYPDVMVICGPSLLTGERPDTVTNPIILVEVLSTSTRDYDRTRKFEHYRSIPTLRDYLLVDQDTVEVEHHWLEEGRWQQERARKLDDVVRLAGVDLALPLAEIYAGVPRE